MEITLQSGSLTLPVVRDGESVGSLTLNPQDVAFVNRFYALAGQMHEAQQKLEQEMQNTMKPAERVQKMQAFCMRINAGIDQTFGEGTAQMLFGNACAPALLTQFFGAVAQAVQQAREQKLAAYTAEA